MELENIKSRLEATGLTKSSVDVNIKSLTRITNRGKLNKSRKYDIKGDPEILKDRDFVLSYIYDDSVCLNTKKTLLNSVINIARVMDNFDKKLIKEYEKHFKDIADVADKARIYAPANEKEKENEITMDDLVKLREKYKGLLTEKYNPKIDYKYVLLSLYTYLPPLRTQEWTNTKMFDENPPEDYKGNYINMKTGKMSIKESKTKKFFGERLIHVPKELRNILKTHRKKSGSDYVLFNLYDKNQKTNESNISHMLNRIIGKKTSVQMLRKIYISERLDKGMNAKERKILSYIMGHSPSSQLLIYSKFSKDLHKSDD